MIQQLSKTRLRGLYHAMSDTSRAHINTLRPYIQEENHTGRKENLYK